MTFLRVVNRWIARRRARFLLTEAFWHAESRQWQQAIGILRVATAIDPSYPAPYNELAYCLEQNEQFDEAEEAARRATTLDPFQPKYRNVLLNIQLDRCRRLRSRKEITDALSGIQRNVDCLIADCPDYPGAYLTKAIVLALGGADEKVWNSMIGLANSAYRAGRHMCSGLPVTEKSVDTTMQLNRSECARLKQYWDSLPVE